ncbi:28S ribosomal protein S9, mitochondrial-like [Eurytemora carolleeae]|uniref:28S ribosomal protein S9, mitochondrial-like n=1 Tax=Eurytemora carolleeae TaxID=1294199 RepID=UPI000C767B9E|nr:28S ribosomal protein S9, mitochondrial-like [Eurytemora carolleeae]|eukprot:XP_023337829.1 28S ribosomal protein S9, mitochondrial-like [Eurytemora affinis]
MAGAVCRTWQRSTLLPGLFSSLKAQISTFPILRSTQEETSVLSESERVKQERKMSSAMRLYLQRKRDHDIFISSEEAEFEMGRQHLANMMGMDHATMTQENIDESIEYLFPSGLVPEARPIMKPPKEIFPRQKEAEFDAQGRPYQTFFYTRKPDLQNRIFKLRDSIEAVTIFGERLAKQGKRADPQQVLDMGQMADSRWITKDELSSLTLELITDSDHREFVNVLERLVSLPFSYRVRDEIFSYRVSEGISLSKQTYLVPEHDEKGRAFVEFEGQRKTAWAHVRVTKPGSGGVVIKHAEHPHYLMDLGYFFALKERLAIMYPLQFTKLLGLVDLDITVKGGGVSAQAGAVRYALSMCLRSFVEKSVVDDMKINGLLTQDIRVRERKKPGKSGARKNYTWKRR